MQVDAEPSVKSEPSVTANSPRAHREVTERSPRGHRDVTERSPRGQQRVADAVRPLRAPSNHPSARVTTKRGRRSGPPLPTPTKTAPSRAATRPATTGVDGGPTVDRQRTNGRPAVVDQRWTRVDRTTVNRAGRPTKRDRPVVAAPVQLASMVANARRMQPSEKPLERTAAQSRSRHEAQERDASSTG